jgi:ParB family chromosome partitioning protein
MEQKRVLIVEPDSAFALSLASIFRDDGCATRVAGTAAEAELEIASRRPDLCVVRAELPDLSGFSLCAHLRRDPATARLPVVLYASETPPEGLAEHARTPWAANGYLAMPLDTDALRKLSASILLYTDRDFALKSPASFALRTAFAAKWPEARAYSIPRTVKPMLRANPAASPATRMPSPESGPRPPYPPSGIMWAPYSSVLPPFIRGAISGRDLKASRRAGTSAAPPFETKSWMPMTSPRLMLSLFV